ncbi:KRAB-A domain-containing protein 2 [Trichonephila clavipes]|nr:KRAB-A domain-containing protein 2 [Trichonephila clavipes]
MRLAVSCQTLCSAGSQSALSVFCKCQMKHSVPKKAIVVKPMISYELNSRYQDLIDLQSNRDGEYKFLMAYQDHLTKFVQLRPLKTKRAEEEEYHVLATF